MKVTKQNMKFMKLIKQNIKKLLQVFLLGSLAVITLFFSYKGAHKDLKKKMDSDYPVWIEMMETPGVNLFEARKAFDDYWKHHAHFKGDQSKQFERWYTRNVERIDTYGNVIPYTKVIEEFQRMRSLANFTQLGQWFNYGPINVGPRNGVKRDGGRVKDIEFHPTDPNTYYVSCFKSGLFRTLDAGDTWDPLTDQLPNDVRISKVLPSTPTTIFIGTATGLLKSIDDGATWNTTGLSIGATNAVLIKPDNENIILAGNQNGIYRSTDGGTTFTLVQAASKVEELRVHPTDPSIMYAGTNGGTQGSTINFSQFFRSVDGGLTWSENTADFGDGTFMKIAVTPAQPNYVYVINSKDHLGNDSFDGVYLSTDSGVTFTKRSGGTPNIIGYDDTGGLSRGQPSYNLFIVADPTDANLLYAGGVKSWKSIDGGTTWTQVFNNVTTDGGGLHLDQLTWAHSPHNNTLFAVNDGGIYFLNNEDKFQQITDGLPIAEIWECTQSQQNKENVAGGTFHGGIKLNKDGRWLSPWGGDESTVLFDYSDDTYAYHFKYEKIHRSSDGGRSFQRINPTTADRGEYTGTGVLDKSDVNILYAGLFEVERINNARTANSSTVWDKISSFGGSTKIQKIEQADANHNIMYVSRNGTFYRSDNVRAASPSFTDITANLIGSGSIADIATHPTDENLVYILRGNKIYKSSNKGMSWTDISNGLPNIPMLEMVYDKLSNEGIYIGTDMGVYYKDATMSSWIDYSNGLPVIRVSGMDIYYGTTRNDSFLTIATDGRGFWRSALSDVVVNSPVADFSVSNTSTLVGGIITFNDTSTNNPAKHEWTFEGGEPTESLDVNPNVVYNTPGQYLVTLKVTNSAGNDIKSINNYITVSAGGDLQAHYNFDNDLLDSSGYARHLTATNYPNLLVFENDHIDQAFSAITTSGVGSFLQETNNFSISSNDARTVTAWIKTNVNAYQGIVSMGSTGTRAKYSVIINASGQFRTEVSGTGHNGTTDIADGTWHHVASVYDGAGTNTLYVDGVQVSTNNIFGTLVTSEAPLLVASEKFNPSARGFQGALDDVRVYSRALTSNEITTIMSGNTLSFNEVNLLDQVLEIYPNPFTDNLSIKVPFTDELKIILYDLSGKVIRKKHTKSPTKGNIEIKTNDVPSGVYILSVQQGTSEISRKIVKINN